MGKRDSRTDQPTGLYRRFARRMRNLLGRNSTVKGDIAALETKARSLRARVQYVMDIDPTSGWYQRELAARFGGFHPPGETRALTQCFPGDPARADMLTLLLREITVNAVPGAIAELGVYRGTSARLIHHYCPERKLYLFDTFSGFTDADMARESMRVAYNQTQQFADTNIALVLRTIEPRNPNVTPVPGSFPDSLTPEIRNEAFAFVHLDVDLEEPTRSGLAFFWPRLNPGGFLVVHDYNAWPGVRIAVDDLRRRQAIAAVPMPDKSGSIVLAKL
jgi:O-methyltransferase